MMMMMDATAFLESEIDKLENALIGKRLPADEVSLSSNIGRQIAHIAMGLLEQEQGFLPAEGEALIPFDDEQCLQVVHLFLAGITHASIKAWEYKITGDPKSAILQSLSEELFTRAKQVTATTIGQELTPDMAFNDKQQIQWMQQAAEGALSHYWQLYEREHGRITHQNNPAQSASALATYQSQQETRGEELASSVVEEPSFPSPSPAHQQTLGYVEQQEHPTPVSEYATTATQPHTPLPLMDDKQERLLTKLAALGLFLTTQSEDHQKAWLAKFPAEHQQWIMHYMNPQAVMEERQMEAVVAALNTLTQSINTQKEHPTFQQNQTQHQLQTLLQQCGWQTVEGLLQAERPAVKTFLHALATNQPLKSAPFSTALQQSMLQYFQTILVGG
jgi:hypothetical protein